MYIQRNLKTCETFELYAILTGNLQVADEASLKIQFQGTINNTMAGFYRSKYKPVVTPAASVPMDGDHHVMFSTQFESCDARRAFPCFDEPNLKATFEFGIEIPSDQVALSNMPVKSTVKSSKDGFQEVCLFVKQRGKVIVL